MTELDANRVPRHTGRDVDNAAPTRMPPITGGAHGDGFGSDV
jgi:hypothetical protein